MHDNDLVVMQLLGEMVKLGLELLRVTYISAASDVWIVLERGMGFRGTVIDCAENEKAEEYQRPVLAAWHAERITLGLVPENRSRPIVAVFTGGGTRALLLIFTATARCRS